MTKLITLLVAKVLLIASTSASFIWIIVEFILYLAKDIPFNWWSIWTYLILGASAIAITLWHALAEHKYSESIKSPIDKLKGNSAFQKRLEKEMKKQKELKTKN